MTRTLRFVRHSITVLTLALASAALSSRADAQHASFVYRLGRDTVAIEQFTRAPNRISGEMVQRTGALVILTRYEMALRSDGRPATVSLRRMQPDGTPLPNQPTEIRLTFTADSVVREVVRADSTQRAAHPIRGAMMAFPVYVYGPMELLAAMRRGGAAVDSIPALGIAGGPVFTGLERVSDDTLRIRGGIYPMRLVFDRTGLLQAIDGGMTTNKIIATRQGGGLDLAAMARAMRPTGTLSTRDVARGAFGTGGIILVDYGRPMVRERTVWGGVLVPVDSVWRAGANDATHLFTTRNLTFGSTAVPAGTYTLWVQHTRTGTFLIVNRKTGQWGTEYDPAQDVVRIPMQMTPTPGHLEQFTITVRNLGQNRGALDFAWGNAMWSAEFTATAR